MWKESAPGRCGLDNSATPGRCCCIPRESIAAVNEVFTPGDEEIRDARALVATVEAQVSAGRGVGTHRGRMVDAAHLKSARALLQWAESIKSAQGVKE